MDEIITITFMPSEFRYAQAYVPFQRWEEPYGYCKALKQGTIFPSLDMPFTKEMERQW